MAWAALFAASIAAVAVSCGGKEDPPVIDDDPLPARDAASAPDADDAAAPPDVVPDPLPTPVPFQEWLVLRLEPDAPGGLADGGVWRDVSPKAHAVSVALGTPVVETSGDAGARVMSFGMSGPVFEVADQPDLRFGTTDDFLFVARVTSPEPLSGNGGCTFRYLFGKYASDGIRGVAWRLCARDEREITGALSLVSENVTAIMPASFVTTFGVTSFGRNLSGTRIEVAAGATVAQRTGAPYDVDATGSPAMIGGFRGMGTGAVGGAYRGKVNRLYVYHAPGGTFSASDFTTIRNFVAAAAPLP